MTTNNQDETNIQQQLQCQVFHNKRYSTDQKKKWLLQIGW